MKYDLNKSLMEQILEKATNYEKSGDKVKAQEFFLMAEKLEKTLAKNSETIANITKTKGER